MFTGRLDNLHLCRIDRPDPIPQLADPKNADMIALMFVRALLIDRQNPIKTNGNGPRHAPVVIWEDTHGGTDYDVLNYDSSPN